jgi:hypothetical protein
VTEYLMRLERPGELMCPYAAGISDRMRP